jgi:DNA-binding response OmpR family regulator
MIGRTRILIADDDDLFLSSTADLLREAGYDCDCAADGASAREKINQIIYDAVVVDIKMPGNANFELVRGLPPGLPAILITGYPTVQSAIEAIRLRVVSYLVKPFAIEELVKLLVAAVQYSRSYRAVTGMLDRLRQWEDDLQRSQDLLRTQPKAGSQVSVELFLDLTLRNITGALIDIRNLTEAVAFQDGRKDVCQLLGCPKSRTLINALRGTTEVLEKTKTSFKSRELAELRSGLEDLLRLVSTSP